METTVTQKLSNYFDDLREVLTNKPAKGHAAKANTTPKRFVREIRDVELGEYKVGDEVKADIFEAGDFVDVTGTSKGTWFPRIALVNIDLFHTVHKR